MKKSIFLFFAAILCAIGMNATTWTVAGDKANILNGTSTWTPSDTKNDMTNVSGTKWGLLVMNKSLAKTTYKFKVCKDHDWGEAYPSSDYAFNIGSAGTYNIIYRFNTNGKTVGADYFKTWTVAGSDAVLGDGWKPEATANDMTRNGNTFEYVLTKKDVKLEKGATYECKVCKDHAWGTAYPGDNHKFSVTTTGYYDVTFKFNVATETVDVTTTLINCKVTTSANPTEGGTVTGGGEYAKGSNVTLTATPATGYEFENWKEGETVVSTSTQYNFTLLNDVNLVANFKIPVPDAVKYQVNVSANDNAMGTATGTGEYEEGATAILTATANDGYQFVNWTVGGVEVSTANPYTFTVNADITVTANFEETPKETVYFVNNGGWTGVSIYGWGGSVTGTGINTWSGVPMTKTGETLTIDGKNYDIYSYSAEVGAVKNILFNYNGDANKTSDFVWTDGKYYYNGAAKDFEGTTKEGVVTALSTPIPDETVYLINTGNWSKAMIYTWNGVGGTPWPGVEMTLTGETIEGYAVYSYTAKQGGQANLLFQESADVNKTTDLEWQAGKYYAPSKNAWYDDAAAAKAALAGPATIVLHGDFVKADWGDTDAFELSADEKTATLTVLIKAGNYEFGVKLNNVWTSNGKAFTKTNNEHVIEAGSGNLTLNADITGNYVFTWTYETNTLTVTYPTEEVVVETNYYVTGTFNNNEPADANYKMTLEGEVYKATVGLKKGENKLKITDGSWDNTWGYGQLGANYQEVSDPNDFNNILITLDEDKNIVVVFADGKITFEGLTVAAPAEKHYYLIGTFNEWTLADANYELALVDGLYKKEVTLAKDAEFKVNQGDWDASWGKDNLGGKTYAELDYTDDGNLKMKEEKTFTVIFNLAANLITFTGLTETTPAVQTNTYVLMGVNGDWTTGITMTVNPDNADEYVLKAQFISSTDAIKVLETAGSTQTWHSTVDAYSNATFELVDDGFGGKNIVLPAGTYNFYFKKINNEIYIEEVYVRDVTNTYGTICLPYASNSYDGAIFYRVAGKETGKVYLESVSELEAGVPYIFEKTASKIVVARNGDPVATAGNANGLVGTFTDETVVAAGNYILYNNQLRPSDGSAKVNANRAYLVMEDVKGGKPTQMPGRRYIGMDVQGENVETGVEDLFTTDAPVKVIENGQLIIIRDGVKYNVQGQKL